jgi:hypothetical protein
MRPGDDPDWLPIEYGEFYDVPRLFWIARTDDALLFDCPFSDDLDDYPNHYDVYALPPDDLPRRGEPWTLSERARSLGRVPVGEVRFDESRRRAIRRDLIARFANRFARPS